MKKMNSPEIRLLFLSLILVVAPFAIAFLLIFTPLYDKYSASKVERSERMDRLRILLCEEIKLGMIKDQVISILEQKGEIRINGNYDGPDLNLDFVYTDPALNKYYGRFNMVISNYKYISSSMPIGFEEYEMICSLH